MGILEIAALGVGLVVGFVLLVWFITLVTEYDKGGVTFKDFRVHLEAILKWVVLAEGVGGLASGVLSVIMKEGIWWYLVGVSAVFFPIAFAFFFGRFLLKD